MIRYRVVKKQLKIDAERMFVCITLRRPRDYRNVDSDKYPETIQLEFSSIDISGDFHREIYTNLSELLIKAEVIK